jgi:uncharacterized membrane protein
MVDVIDGALACSMFMGLIGVSVGYNSQQKSDSTPIKSSPSKIFMILTIVLTLFGFLLAGYKTVKS